MNYKFSITLIIIPHILFSQTFYKFKHDAMLKYKLGRYLQAGRLYDEAFLVRKGNKYDYYRAACAWSKASDTLKAYDYLIKSIERGYEDFDDLIADKDLAILRKSNKWEMILDKIEKEKEYYSENYNKKLSEWLGKLREMDQKYRTMMDSVGRKFGWGSIEYHNLWRNQTILDSLNELSLDSIITIYGWPSRAQVREKGINSAFLVILHSPLSHQEKYLSLLVKAANNDELEWNRLAYLIDKIKLKKGEKQIFGTQVYFDSKTKKYILYKTKEIKNLDKRRDSVGLGPIEEYLKRFNSK